MIGLPSNCEPWQGFVASFDPARALGWIEGGLSDRIFFHSVDVIPDVVGRTFLLPGTPVSFLLRRGTHGNCRALRITDILDETKAIDPNTYEEMGQLAKWEAAAPRGPHGYVVRPNGEHLFVPGDCILTLGEETLKTGSWLRYRIGSRIRGSDRKRIWFARHVEIFAPGYMPEYPPDSIEAQLLAAPELPATPAPVSTPVELQIYTATERKLSLRELIKLRRKVA